MVGSEDLDRARHGDWPWHVALIKEVGDEHLDFVFSNFSSL